MEGAACCADISASAEEAVVAVVAVAAAMVVLVWTVSGVPSCCLFWLASSSLTFLSFLSSPEENPNPIVVKHFWREIGI